MNDDDGEVGVVSSTREEEATAEEEERYLCRLCGTLITTGKQRIEVDGGHLHTFVNPAGYVYRIACFQDARGCRITGEPTADFTWFARHTWAYAECASCGSHLGWSYFRGSRLSFYGLLVERLVCSGGS